MRDLESDRKDARVILIAFLDQHVKSPLESRSDRKIRRTVADHGAPGDDEQRAEGELPPHSLGVPDEERRQAEDVRAGGGAGVAEVFGGAPVAAEPEHTPGDLTDLQLAFELEPREG